MAGRAAPKRESAELLGQLARELSTLVRREVEVAAAERVPTLRRALLDLAAVAAVAVAVLFALAALTVAGERALATAVPGWSAALLVGAVWGALAAVGAFLLLRPRAQPREREELVGLLQMVARRDGLEKLQASRREARDEADEQVRATSDSLVRALLDEVVEHQAHALPHVAARQLETAAEAAAPDLLSEALTLLTAPARAGLTVLGRLAEPAPLARAGADRGRRRAS
ncbi:MAG: phage holin family protein [Actinomycetota bacterium]|nr:phage holin family protein [Actinomycetota bacterium]